MSCAWLGTPALLLAVVLPGMAGAADASLEVTLPEGAFEVGDPVALVVQARGGEGSLWGELSVGARDQDSWALVDPPRTFPGSQPPAWEVTVAPLKTGELELPILVAGLRDGEGIVSEIVAENAPAVTVASVLGPEDDGAPAPLRAPFGVQGFPWEWVLPIGLAVLPLLLVAAWWVRRRGGRVGDGQEIPALPPFQELQRMLGELKERGGLLPAAEVCDRLAGGLRRYLERRTGEPAAEMTSHELRLLARKSSWPTEIQAGLQRVTAVADGVRFGRRKVAEAELALARETTLGVGRELERHLTPAGDEGEDES